MHLVEALIEAATGNNWHNCSWNGRTGRFCQENGPSTCATSSGDRTSELYFAGSMVAGLCSSNHWAGTQPPKCSALELNCNDFILLTSTSKNTMMIIFSDETSHLQRLTVDPVQVSRPDPSCLAMWNSVWESRWDERLPFLSTLAMGLKSDRLQSHFGSIVSSGYR